jgi:hypothetical protein
MKAAKSVKLTRKVEKWLAESTEVGTKGAAERTDSLSSMDSVNRRDRPARHDSSLRMLANARGGDCAPSADQRTQSDTTGVRCSFLMVVLHLRMSLNFTPLIHLKRNHACDSMLCILGVHSLTGFHCKFRPSKH